MEKQELRDQLFQQFFNMDNGILAKDLLDKLYFIPEAWRKLRTMCLKNISGFDMFSSIETMKLINYKNKEYLIIKLRFWKYSIIDVKNMNNLSTKDLKETFDEEFFINNFDEKKDQDESLFDLYRTNPYNGDIKELMDFYVENKKILELSPKIYSRLTIGDAWMWIFIDLVNAKIQMGFQTMDKYLYEQLFLNYDLTPSLMQDATERIGIAKMNEYFSKMKELEIPMDCIPEDLKTIVEDKEIKKIRTEK